MKNSLRKIAKSARMATRNKSKEIGESEQNFQTDYEDNLETDDRESLTSKAARCRSRSKSVEWAVEEANIVEENQLLRMTVENEEDTSFAHSEMSEEDDDEVQLMNRSNRSEGEYSSEKETDETEEDDLDPEAGLTSQEKLQRLEAEMQSKLRELQLLMSGD